MNSPWTGRRYPLSMVCAVYRLPRSTFYVQSRGSATGETGTVVKPGPRSRWSDEEVLAGIRRVLQESPFHNEGYRKVRARLRARGISVGRNRVLRIMRENGLLAPVRRYASHGDRAHGGKIRAERPNELWGADATRFYTRQDGWCWFLERLIIAVRTLWDGT